MPSTVSGNRASWWPTALVAVAALWFYGRLLAPMRYTADDAYIAFRHVRNDVLYGWGLVWNPPPFRPVEGYTSFLWVAILDVVWRVTGLDPTVTAGPLLDLCGAATILLVAGWVASRTRHLGRVGRPVAVAATLALLVSNRTFLAWQTSGLETGLYVTLVTAWLIAVVGRAGGELRALAHVALASALALTRPDGALFVLASVALVLPDVWTGAATPLVARRPLRELVRTSLPLWPCGLLAAHEAWRLWRYAEWLPNTWYAKSATRLDVTASGLRYAGSFAVEYGVWMWILLVAGALAWTRPRPSRAVVAAVLALIAHAAFYTLRMGGDHFEFRVYAHLVPAMCLGLAAALAPLGRVAFVAGFAAWAVVGLPVGWLHLRASRTHTMREHASFLHIPVAPLLAAEARWLPDVALAPVRAYDDWQGWLIQHAVGMRHQEHAAYSQWLLERMPLVELPEAPGMVWVAVEGNIGVTGWTQPRVAILDLVGLTDHVTARNADLSTNGWMSHERQAPQGYLSCFDKVFGSRARMGARQVPADRIVACEDAWWSAWRDGPPPDPDAWRSAPATSDTDVVDNPPADR